MPPAPRKRSSSGVNTSPPSADDRAQQLLLALLKEHRHRTHQSILHTAATIPREPSASSSTSFTLEENLALAAALVERCAQADYASGRRGDANSASCVRELLLNPDAESGYTPLHWAIYQGNLPMILLLLQAASSSDQAEDAQQQHHSSSCSSRRIASLNLKRRPMELLMGDNSSSNNNHHHTSAGSASLSGTTAATGTGGSAFKRKSSRTLSFLNSTNSSLLTHMIQAVDWEGKTPGELLADRQRSELLACRLSLYRPKIIVTANGGNSRTNRANSFDVVSSTLDEQNEFDLLSQSMRQMQQQQERQDEEESIEREEEQVHRNDGTATMSTYGCEVFTFGRAHHCALGVVASTVDHNHHSTHRTTMNSSNEGTASSSKFRPVRVQAFAHDTVGREGRAVAIAGATHHTLVATADGQLFAFGLGKGGRLGTGNESPCSLPTRVRGALSSRCVVAVAAAENHSLCLTKCGSVYAWGSNRFGQLGITASANMSSSSIKSTGVNDDSGSRCCSPRRVDDLKASVCVAIAAGEKHSVALSNRGEVFVWGDNSSGQLGTNRRNGTRKVQRVEYLWNASPPKACISVSASDQTTMVLAVPTGGGLPVNSIYAWGHGSLPSRVQFESCAESRNRPINPVGIACARYHNVAITSDGHVYTWGLHADALGTKKSTKASSFGPSTPQLVTGLLPKNGGGKVVAVAASENHTAVVSDTGALFTWGATHGKDVLGHEGVRWQPDPKRVPGVHRVVGVSVAKEHTILLVGASFPGVPHPVGDESLESLAARTVAQHVDLFNVLPVAIMANRFENAFLKDYCSQFIRRNLDGVMNVCQKRILNSFFTEQLASATSHVDKDSDGVYHPLLFETIAPNCEKSESLRLDTLLEVEEWLQECGRAAESTTRRSALSLIHKTTNEPESVARKRSESLVEENSVSSRCLDLTTNMNLGTKELADSKQSCLTKEIRSIRKRLSQIAKLEVGAQVGSTLTREEEEKISKKSQLKADLRVFEPALRAVHRKLEELCLAELKVALQPPDAPADENEKNFIEQSEPLASIRCDVCKIVCMDQKNFEMHLTGRKHRNKLAQAADEEKKQAALKMMAEQQRQEIIGNRIPPPIVTPKMPDAWDAKKSQAQPKFNLPPPPVPIPDSITTPCIPKRIATPSLLDIMAEEQRKSGPSSKKKVNDGLLALPTGAHPTMKLPPWASAPMVNAVSPSIPNQGATHLADFMPSSARTKARTKQELPGSWASPKTESPLPSPSTLNFADIQQQERSLKAKEDPTFGANGKWFIERRERAESFREIEYSTARESEYRLLLEEQLRIEKQIQEELELKRNQAEKLASKNSRNQNRKAGQNGSSSATKKDVVASREATAKPNQSKSRKRNGRIPGSRQPTTKEDIHGTE